MRKTTTLILKLFFVVLLFFNSTHATSSQSFYNCSWVGRCVSPQSNPVFCAAPCSGSCDQFVTSTTCDGGNNGLHNCFCPPGAPGTYSCLWSNGCVATDVQCGAGYVPGSTCTGQNFTACNQIDLNNGQFNCVLESTSPGSSSLDLNRLYGVIQTFSVPLNMNDSLGSIVSGLLIYIFPLAGLVLLLYLLYGGYNMMLSGGDPKRAASAKSIITSALIGFVIIFMSYWIVQIVGSILGLGFSSIFG